MKNKPWSLCATFGCRHKTWSGRIERDKSSRHCIYHSPKAKEKQRVFLAKCSQYRNDWKFGWNRGEGRSTANEEAAKEAAAKEELERNTPKRPKRGTNMFANLYAMPLVCVFRPYGVVEENDCVVRVVFAGEMCLAEAPRRNTGDRTLPRYPNRFGEPLCKPHAWYRDDEHAFPGVVPIGFQVIDEAEEERTRNLAELVEMNQELVELNRKEANR